MPRTLLPLSACLLALLSSDLAHAFTMDQMKIAVCHNRDKSLWVYVDLNEGTVQARLNHMKNGVPGQDDEFDMDNASGSQPRLLSTSKENNMFSVTAEVYDLKKRQGASVTLSGMLKQRVIKNETLAIALIELHKLNVRRQEMVDCQVFQ
jgi:hypothetical protein